jgi:hypothetical protein
LEEVAINTEKLTVYVRLLDEGTEVSRPTQATLVKEDVYQLLPNQEYDSEEEHWEFPPGSMVKVARILNCDRDYLIATGIAD